MFMSLNVVYPNPRPTLIPNPNRILGSAGPSVAVRPCPRTYLELHEAPDLGMCPLSLSAKYQNFCQNHKLEKNIPSSLSSSLVFALDGAEAVGGFMRRSSCASQAFTSLMYGPKGHMYAFERRGEI